MWFLSDINVKDENLPLTIVIAVVLVFITAVVFVTKAEKKN
jgi:hypothetical protein